MERSIQLKLDKFEAEEAFMRENIVDFPEGTPGADAHGRHVAIIEELRDLAAQQISEGGEARQAQGSKDDALDEIMAFIKNINRAANSFEDEIPGSDMLFRMPRNRSQQNILATARAFHQDSAPPLEAKFIEYGLAPTFRTDLETAIDAFDAAASDADAGKSGLSAATAGLSEAARRGMRNSEKLDGIVKIKYNSDVQKLAAWTVASHLERAPRAKPTPPAPTT